MSAPASTAPTTIENEGRIGFFYAVAAYLIWGALPIYFSFLAHVSALEVLAHRMIWSVPFVLVVLFWTRRLDDLRQALKTPRMLALALAPALLVSANWGTYVWAITSGHALDAALGYYINPLLSVLLGALLLRERIIGWQWLAILSAAVGVAILTVENGRLPVVALALAITWAFYAYFKRSLPLGPNQGFALEVIILLPFALIGAGWFLWSGRGHFLTGDVRADLFLVGTGVITAGPLMLFANGAKRLRMTTIAMMQYSTPSLIFLTAIFVFHEPFSRTKLLAFGFIWAALAIYTLTVLREAGKARAERHRVEGEARDPAAE